MDAAAATPRWNERWRRLRGVLRSLHIYYGDRKRRAAMETLYGRFVRPGDLVLDVGAHVGDRVAVFRRLGARVVAIEPQPALVRTLRLLYGRDHAVQIEPSAVGASIGWLDLRINVDNPTVSSASPEFLQAAHGSRGWEGQVWGRTIRVPVTTLDMLVARHGLPSFIKIDVEGFEAQVLSGLTRSPRALSFEFTTIQREVAADCVARCVALGYERFNAMIGESHILIHAGWVSAQEITEWLRALPHDANSGDIYALAS
jgi:FkbM family methyltransferase